MEPEGSLPHSQEPATCPYPEPISKIICNFMVCPSNVHLYTYVRICKALVFF
jgi:hypothetical protein